MVLVSQSVVLILMYRWSWYGKSRHRYEVSAMQVNCHNGQCNIRNLLAKGCDDSLTFYLLSSEEVIHYVLFLLCMYSRVTLYCKQLESSWSQYLGLGLLLKLYDLGLAVDIEQPGHVLEILVLLKSLMYCLTICRFQICEQLNSLLRQKFVCNRFPIGGLWTADTMVQVLTLNAVTAEY